MYNINVIHVCMVYINHGQIYHQFKKDNSYAIRINKVTTSIVGYIIVLASRLHICYSYRLPMYIYYIAIPRLRAVSRKSTSFVRKWQEAPNATSYQIKWQEFENNISDGVDNILSTPDLIYPIMDLMTSTNYIVTVCALRDNATLGCSTIDVKTFPAGM